MVSQRIKGRIVFVSSFLGYTSFAGYSPYSPGKYAVRGTSYPRRSLQMPSFPSPRIRADRLGLADTLRSELLQHDISVHVYLPAGIDSPGYVEEQRSKPRITKKIEEGDEVLSPESVAKSLIVGKSTCHTILSSLYAVDAAVLNRKHTRRGGRSVRLKAM